MCFPVLAHANGRSAEPDVVGEAIARPQGEFCEVAVVCGGGRVALWETGRRASLGDVTAVFLLCVTTRAD